MAERTAMSLTLTRVLQQLVRRLLRRPPPRYPRIVEFAYGKGARARITITGPLRPDLWDEPGPQFESPATMDDGAEIVRPRLLPPLAVQLAALRQRTLELAGLLDDDDTDQERDRKLLWWFRGQRDQAD
jgi:hypothetical protein